MPQLKFASLPKAKTRRSYFFFARVGGVGHFPGGSAGETSAYNARDIGWISALGRCSGGGHGNPPQYSCLENPMDRGAWQATVHGVAKSRTQLKGRSMHAGTTLLKLCGGVWGGGQKTLPATEHRLLHLGPLGLFPSSSSFI